MPYLTANDPGVAVRCYPLGIPDDLYFRAAVKGQLSELTDPANWEQFGTLTPEQCAALAETMLQNFLNETCQELFADMDLIADYPLQTAVISSFDVVSIPQTYNNLRLLIRGRSDASQALDEMDMTFQADGSPNFDMYNDFWYPLTAQQIRDNQAGVSYFQTGLFAGATTPIANLGVTIVDIFDYSSIVHAKPMRCQAFRYTGGANLDNLQICNAWAYWLRNSWQVEEIHIVPTAGSNWTTFGCQVWGW